MFQDFTAPSRPDQSPPRVADLRGAMACAGIDAFLVPRADAHQGEYVAPRDARLSWLTGFTGSAGMAVILHDRAAIFVDGRYTLQARDQVDGLFEIVEIPGTRAPDWLADILSAGATVGFDPWLHTRAEFDAMEKAFRGRDIALRAVGNLVDEIWTDQPEAPHNPVTAYPEALAGKSRALKCAELAETLSEAGQDWAALTLPDSICWLLNIRGSDIPRNPIAHGFALLEAETAKVRLFMDAAKLDGLDMTGVEVLPQDGFPAALATLSGTVRVDRETAPHAVGSTLSEAGVAIDWDADPCLLPKARKTEAELDATRDAHLTDGAAMCEFLCWLDERLGTDDPLTEIDVVRALEGFRSETGALRDISFDTIAGTGPNGAIIHYRVSEDSNRTVAPGDLLLVDSGGQYEGGTTDITRTLPVGKPDADQIAAFTCVLKGMVAISRARFPKGLAGRDLDALARAPLWRAGQDYAHGTGHGVGVYLSVHEGPQRLSRHSETVLEPGMILSNEPGYYRAGDWGIRIENLIVTREADPLPGGDADRSMYDFETLTWVPIDRRLIDVAALSPGERTWIDAYHAGVTQRMTGRLGPAATAWLAQATAPL